MAERPVAEIDLAKGPQIVDVVAGIREKTEGIGLAGIHLQRAVSLSMGRAEIKTLAVRQEREEFMMEMIVGCVHRSFG